MTDSEATDDVQIETADTSLTVRRTFEAPWERVYQAFTDPTSYRSGTPRAT